VASKKKPTVVDATPASQSFAEVWKALDTIHARLDDAEEAISDLEVGAADFDGRLEDIEDRVDVLADQADTTSLADDCLAPYSEEIDTEISELKEAVTALQESLESLQGDVEMHDEDIVSIFDSVTDLQNSVKDLEADADATQTLANLQPTFCEKLDEDDDMSGNKDLNYYAELCHYNARDNGWWHDDDPTIEKEIGIVGSKLLMIHSEISEATEELRDIKLFSEFSQPSYSEGGKPEGFAVELADTLIRLFDLAGYLGIDLDDLVNEKLEYNKTRGHRHGGKKV
jgi:chromosome segregation ATPase